MTLLCLLLAAVELERVSVVAKRKINLEMVGSGQREPQFLGVAADLVVIHGQAAAEDNVVHAVQCRSAEAVLLGQGG